ncbi:ABC transporter permease [Paenibacillus albiflavus]|uniref:ABC transporter permease n=1 Tax=Paenibacillus albiflavus TaxID=2545760 RepID=A0A4R4EKG2_9BACL|nr:ABC transporter permease subunit [Paenibacillus albiflavus]TCZ78768.1 ABC transporter permease [Paenibacillus albiflavus]
MRQWLVIYRKEMSEMGRNYKWLWVPLIFILLGIMQPVMLYYMSDILKSAGNLPAGTVVEFPLPSGGEVLMQTLGQYGMMGVLILVLSMMTVVSGERNSGVIELILVKPVSYTKFITAKWAGMLTITTVSLSLGYLASWYYTMLLFETVQITDVLVSLCIYLLWFFLIVSVTLLTSTMFRSFGATAFVTIGCIAVLTLLTNLWTKALAWSPSRLSALAGQWVMGKPDDEPIAFIIIVAILCMVGCLLLSVTVLRNKQSLS